MAFSEQQIRKLKAKLSPKHVKTRTQNGVALSYVEGWHALAEANRIFGFEGWDRETVTADCVWSEIKRESSHAVYVAKVRLTVRAGDMTIVREGSGTGEGKGTAPGEAHDMALKAAETDATKRALATFGNPFGLALYDKEKVGVRKVKPKADAKTDLPTLQLKDATGVLRTTFSDLDSFADGFAKAMEGAQSVKALFEIWEHNRVTVSSIRKIPSPKAILADTLVKRFKTQVIALGDRAVVNRQDERAQTKIDKNQLRLGEPKRVRSKEHLAFVKRKPCLVCGRAPSQAHHLRFAQPRAMARKVSDEFTVPLCNIHHFELHQFGDEKNWWKEMGIDPLLVARKLWLERRKGKMKCAIPS